MMSIAYVFSLINDSPIIKTSETAYILHTFNETITIPTTKPGLFQAFQILTTKGATEDVLIDLVSAQEGFVGSCEFRYYLELCAESKILCRTLQWNNLSIATLEGLSSSLGFQSDKVLANHLYKISRFTYCTWTKGKPILSSALSSMQVILHDANVLGLLSQLASPIQYIQLIKNYKGIENDLIKPILQMFITSKIIVGLDSECTAEEDRDEALVQWEFHDLLFHTYSRIRKGTKVHGATYRFKDVIHPLSCTKKDFCSERISLYKPDIVELQQKDVSFTQVIEKRRSSRYFGKQPLSVHQLGEFLFRSARERKSIHDQYQELSNRPYPNGGAIYELELYLVIDKCLNLADGLYRYDAQKHCLCQYACDKSALQALLKSAATTSRVSEIQVLGVISARFQRVTWKYESMAYSLILKNVGVLFQTMYLVATAMNLAVCALGSGDSEQFAVVAGLNPLIETSVGEFILGSQPEEF